MKVAFTSDEYSVGSYTMTENVYTKGVKLPARTLRVRCDQMIDALSSKLVKKALVTIRFSNEDEPVWIGFSADGLTLETGIAQMRAPHYRVAEGLEYRPVHLSDAELDRRATDEMSKRRKDEQDARTDYETWLREHFGLEALVAYREGCDLRRGLSDMQHYSDDYSAAFYQRLADKQATYPSMSRAVLFALFAPVIPIVPIEVNCDELSVNIAQVLPVILERYGRTYLRELAKAVRGCPGVVYEVFAEMALAYTREYSAPAENWSAAHDR